MGLILVEVILLFLFRFGDAYGPNIIPEDIAEKIPNPAKLFFTKKCIDDLGCFNTGPPFYHPTVRPISLSPSKPDTKFWLFTSSNPDEKYDLQISIESLRNSSFSSKFSTKFLIHGFRSDLDIGDIRHDIRDALLKEGNYNIIIVDWTANNGFPYAQAVANTRSTGANVAKMIEFLMKNTGITAESIHIIGHSLGAHTAGYAGERIRRLGRITGLDPAGPFFHGMSRKVRLDTTDALFVDVIHTDGGECILNGLGTSKPVGHVDFYPNGGRRQPGCAYTSEKENAIGSAVNFTTQWVSHGCDHERANKLFLESITNKDCKLLGVRCANYREFERGRCPPRRGNVAEMGFHAKPTRVRAKYYLRTNSSSPFCMQHGNVII